MTKPYATLATLALLAPGCDRPPELPPDARVTYDTVDGVPHVISGSRGAWVRGGAWNVGLDGVVIGRLDGPDEYTFSAVAGVVVGRDGRIYVADAQAHEMRVFSRDGEFLSRFGRAGEGPGEFRNISGLAQAPGGIAVLDGRLARVTVFGPDGRVAHSFRVDRPYTILERGAVMGFDRYGRYYERARLSSRPLLDSLAVTVYDRDGQRVRTTLVDVIEQDHLTVERNDVPIMSFPRPFSPRPSLAIGPDGRVYYTRGDEYRVAVLGATGDTLRVLRRRVRPRPVTPAERDSAVADVQDRYRRAGDAVPRTVQLPDSKPTIARLIVDTGGNLWVASFPDPTWSRMEWGVHDPDGRYLGAVATPVMNVLHIGDDVLAGVIIDELDVPRVAVYPILKR